LSTLLEDYSRNVKKWKYADSDNLDAFKNKCNSILNLEENAPLRKEILPTLLLRFYQQLMNISHMKNSTHILSHNGEKNEVQDATDMCNLWATYPALANGKYYPGKFDEQLKNHIDDTVENINMNLNRQDANFPEEDTITVQEIETPNLTIHQRKSPWTRLPD
jgi:hypothetical protein